ncbi:MAG: tRNA (cytosine(32)/uridine(32)-2'-O)-methyltransferase TrmJ [Gammaproteobacteria bacterium CG22_combo_CG10-13_8_21_14_all_40_8]|nr:MAG: tRNA (cytosine(32)/uridine(32)-2'-O)-methyltransferase TrmJ [Gammaproteobacteria bacterium CG22_combo_CG10-13_8_21_14_all_40_8]
MLDRIKIVLINTSHPGNIGAVARAMKTMGILNLCLVDPQQYPSALATERASSAADVLHQAQVVNHIEEAIADCHWVVGASARSRYLDWPLLSPRQLAESFQHQLVHGKVAIVFGRENSGLTNEELQYCHQQINIPANPDYSSLNLAMAVQVVCYELRMQFLQQQAQKSETIESSENQLNLASHDSVEGFYRHFEQTMVKTAFLDPDQPKHLMKRIRRIFGRTALEAQEINILRGFLKSVNTGLDCNHK